MQITLNSIYEELAKERNQEYALIKNVGDTVFKSLLKNFKEPPTIILKVKGIGQFYLRHQRLINDLESRRDFYYNEENEKAIEVKKENLEDFLERKRKYKNFVDRLTDYATYIERKKEIREIRNKTQPLIEKRIEDDN